MKRIYNLSKPRISLGFILYPLEDTERLAEPFTQQMRHKDDSTVIHHLLLQPSFKKKM